MAKIIDGRLVAQKIKERIAQEIKKLKITPGLATILIGDDPASQTYVRMKIKACQDLGIYSENYPLPKDVSQIDVLSLIKKLNNNKKINGILVQLPLPPQLDKDKILEAVDPKKDVDGFHPFNIGKLFLGTPLFYPCTPLGIITLLDEYKIPIQGKKVVIIGRSNIVGKPLFFMFLQRNATVTICHSKTLNLAQEAAQADILVAAMGKAYFVKDHFVKEGAVVIDVGTNRTETGLVGDVDFKLVSKKASFITPSPGGVGPMTIAILLSNTLQAYIGANR